MGNFVEDLTAQFSKGMLLSVLAFAVVAWVIKFSFGNFSFEFAATMSIIGIFATYWVGGYVRGIFSWNSFIAMIAGIVLSMTVFSWWTGQTGLNALFMIVFLMYFGALDILMPLYLFNLALGLISGTVKSVVIMPDAGTGINAFINAGLEFIRTLVQSFIDFIRPGHQLDATNLLGQTIQRSPAEVIGIVVEVLILGLVLYGLLGFAKKHGWIKKSNRPNLFAQMRRALHL
jgi:hypothetical protein